MDPLASLLDKFRLQASVFHTGLLCSSAAFGANNGVGYIHSLQSGQLKVISEGNPTVVLHAPATIFYSQAVSHQLIPLDDEQECSLVCGSIDFGASAQGLLGLGLPDFVVLTKAQIQPLAPLLEMLFAESSSTAAAKPIALNRLCELLVLQLFRYLMADGQINCSLLAALSDPKLAPLLTALHHSPAQAWTLESMAQLCGMSRAPFAKHFKAVLGMPASEYLSYWRLALVQHLLLDGLGVTQAALEVGYDSPSAMARAFKQRLGLSPTQWLESQTK